MQAGARAALLAAGVTPCSNTLTLKSNRTLFQSWLESTNTKRQFCRAKSHGKYHPTTPCQKPLDALLPTPTRMTLMHR